MTIKPFSPNSGSDTSPILDLLLIDQRDHLPRLYQRIIIPAVVQAEMQTIGAPLALQTWIANPAPIAKHRSLNIQIGEV